MEIKTFSITACENYVLKSCFKDNASAGDITQTNLKSLWV